VGTGQPLVGRSWVVYLDAVRLWAEPCAVGTSQRNAPPRERAPVVDAIVGDLPEPQTDGGASAGRAWPRAQPQL